MLHALDEATGAALWAHAAVDGQGVQWGLAGVAPALDPKAKALDRAVFLAFAGYIAAIDLLRGSRLAASKETPRPWRHYFVGAPSILPLGDGLFLSSVCSDAAACAAGNARFTHFKVKGEGVDGKAFSLGALWIRDLGNVSEGAAGAEAAGGTGGGVVPCGLLGLRRPTAQGLAAQRRALARHFRASAAAGAAVAEAAGGDAEARALVLALGSVEGSCESAAALLRALTPRERAALLAELQRQGQAASDGAWPGVATALLAGGDVVAQGGGGDPAFPDPLAARLEDAALGAAAWTVTVGAAQGGAAADAAGTLAIATLCLDTGTPCLALLEGVSGQLVGLAPLAFPGTPGGAGGSGGGGGAPAPALAAFRPLLYTDALAGGNASLAVAVGQGLALVRGGGLPCPSSTVSLECSGWGSCDCARGVCACVGGHSGAACDVPPSPSPAASPSRTARRTPPRSPSPPAPPPQPPQAGAAPAPGAWSAAAVAGAVCGGLALAGACAAALAWRLGWRGGGRGAAAAPGALLLYLQPSVKGRPAGELTRLLRAAA